MPPSTRIYLDHAATTPPLPEVVEAMQRAQTEAFGNPSSAHGFGRRPHQLLDDAREFVRGTLCAAEVVFTGSGTEADLLGVLGAALARPRGRVLCGAADHPAVLRQRELLGRLGYELVTVPVRPEGDLDPERLFDLLGHDVRVVSILHGHNELGTLADLDQLVDTVRHTAPQAHVHVDLVQSYGKVPFDLDETGVDSVAVSAHKLHGPRGVGFLALSSTAQVHPVMPGGGQEPGFRGGTENVAGVHGLALAAEQVFSQLRATAEHCEALAAACLARVQQVLPAATRLGHSTRRLPHILSLRLPGITGSTLLLRMSETHGVAFATGAACHGEQQSENHVHKAVGLDARASREIVRLSFSRLNTAAEVEEAAGLLAGEIGTLLGLAPHRAGV